MRRFPLYSGAEFGAGAILVDSEVAVAAGDRVGELAVPLTAHRLRTGPVDASPSRRG